MVDDESRNDAFGVLSATMVKREGSAAKPWGKGEKPPGREKNLPARALTTVAGCSMQDQKAPRVEPSSNTLEKCAPEI